MTGNTTPRMLIVAPHPDDSILGSGGTMARFVAAGGEVTVLTVAAHMPPLFGEHIHRQTIEESRQAHALIGVRESLFLDRPALSLSQVPHERLNEDILNVLDRVCPNIVVVPYFDRCVDHRTIFESCMVACRPLGHNRTLSVVAAYEVPCSTHWNAPHLEPNFIPNWTVDISNHIDTKIAMLQCCESQMRPPPHPRSLEVVRALARFRGSQVNVSYGEAFHVIRMSSPPEILAHNHASGTSALATEPKGDIA
jgi:N-acetylglucosamine malate deacetylase 1